MDRFNELGSNPLAAALRHHTVKPGEEDRRLELEAKKEADRLVLEPGDQLENVVSAAKATMKRLQVARRPEDAIVHLRDDRQVFGPNNFNDRIGHETIPSQYRGQE